MFFIIIIIVLILVLVGWNLLCDVKNKVEDIVNMCVSVIIKEYEECLKVFEEKLCEWFEEILLN